MSACPNCASTVANHAQGGCVLAALMDMVRARGNLSEDALLKLHESVDADAFWNAVGPIVDDLEDGRFSDRTERRGIASDGTEVERRRNRTSVPYRWAEVDRRRIAERRQP